MDLKDALDLLDTGNWCGLAYVSYDEKRGTAGEIVRIHRCRLAPAGTTPGRAGGKQVQPAADRSGDRRNPNHLTHATRNVKLANGQIRKLHIRLLFAINGQKLI